MNLKTIKSKDYQFVLDDNKVPEMYQDSTHWYDLEDIVT